MRGVNVPSPVTLIPPRAHYGLGLNLIPTGGEVLMVRGTRLRILIISIRKTVKWRVTLMSA